MEAITLQRAKKDANLHVTMQAELREKLQSFADDNKVSKAQATRYILELFFASNYEKTENLSGKIKKRTQRKQGAK